MICIYIDGLGEGGSWLMRFAEAAAPASSQIKSHIGSSGRSFGLPQPARTTPDNFLDFVFLTLLWWRPWGLFKDWGRWQRQVDKPAREDSTEGVGGKEGWGGIIKSLVSLLLALKLKALVMTRQFKQQEQLHTGMLTTGHSLWFTLLISIHSPFKDKHMTDDSEVFWPSYNTNKPKSKIVRRAKQNTKLNKVKHETEGFYQDFRKNFCGYESLQFAASPRSSLLLQLKVNGRRRAFCGRENQLYVWWERKDFTDWPQS